MAHHNLRSVRSEEKCFVRFINLTERTVDVTWINFNGAYVQYHLLEKGHFVDVNTFKNHPWIARDIATRNCLHIDKKFIFYPQTTREVMQKKYPNRPLYDNWEARIRVYITQPMYSLRYMSLITIRDQFSNVDHVDTLDLPKNLADELKRAIVIRNKECAMILKTYQ